MIDEYETHFIFQNWKNEDSNSISNALSKKSFSDRNSDHPYANPLESTPAPLAPIQPAAPTSVQVDVHATAERVSNDHSYGTRQRLASIRESDHDYSTRIPDNIELVQVVPVRTSQPPPSTAVIIAQADQEHIQSSSLPLKGAAKRKAHLKTQKSRKAFEPINQEIRMMPNKYNCEHCGKTFPQPYKKRRHVQEVHKKIKRHACQYCEKSFFKISSCKRHELTHIEHDTWKCELGCAKIFRDPSSLKYHTQNKVCIKQKKKVSL